MIYPQIIILTTVPDQRDRRQASRKHHNTFMSVELPVTGIFQ